MKATHTLGWYLQSADSQLLVCFGIQVKLEDISSEQQALLCTGDLGCSLPLTCQHSPLQLYLIVFINEAVAKPASTPALSANY